MGEEHVRAFVSIEVGAATLRKLIDFQSILAAKVREDSIRWATPEQLHLTLKFLGNIPAATVPEVSAKLEQACAGTVSFQLTAETLGGFPGLRQPRVLWIGIGGETNWLMGLQQQIDQALAPYSQKEEKRAFRPHITLGRVRETANRNARQIGKILEGVTVPEFGSWTVREVRLMRSQLSPKGSTHSVLTAIPLR
jgi:2'-5' RNA ligase